MLNWVNHRFAMPSLTCRTASLSSIGGRENLEDAFGVYQADAHSGIWVLADGVGGQAAGEVAAQLAVETVLQILRQESKHHAAGLENAIRQANAAVCAAKQSSPERGQMATTLAVLWIAGGHALWAHVGDSRIYRFRGGRLADRSEDHSVHQLLALRSGLTLEQLRNAPQRNTLTQALGQVDIKVSLSRREKLSADEVFLLCSDGWWEYLDDSTMEADFVAATVENWLQRQEQRLLAAVRQQQAGNHDNYTALAVAVEKS